MISYPHASITINHRQATLDDIVAERETPRDDFERNTFHFIRKWFSGHEEFELQTSGSTGAPKKVIFYREQMMASAKMTAQALSLQPHYTALICLDTRYVAGQMMMVRCFTIGMAIYAITPSSNPFHKVKANIDFTALVPYQVYHVLDSGDLSYFDSINTIIIGGAALDYGIRMRLQSYKARFYATYGMTETISHIALQKLNGADQQDTFKALPGVSLIKDSRNCLVLHVPFVDGELITNDLVDLMSEHEFRWLGRWDNVLNSGGVKIIPEKTEESIYRVFERGGLDRKFFLSSIPDIQFGDKIVLFVEGDEFTLQQQEFLRDELPKMLEPYEIPKEVIILNSFEMTQTGKLNRYSTRQNSDKSRQKFTLKK